MIITFEKLSEIKKSNPHKSIVLAGGVFDLIHSGHIDFLRRLRKYGDLVVIALSSDKRAKQRKGSGRPILNEEERLKIINAIKYVDYVLISPKPTPNREVPTYQIIERLKPDVFVTIDRRWKDYEQKVTSRGTKLVIIDIQKTISTTMIIDKIKKLE